ncbi:acetate kinase, ackA [Pediococcus acidilactici D3]|nr:acetate kinase, ackA [Pediococcus acidilactici D3]
MTVKYNGQKYHQELPIPDHAFAVDLLLKLLVELHLLKDLNEITAVGHRVVAGGEYFDHSVVIDDDVIKKIDEISDLARLHNPANLLGIKVFKKLLPNALAVASFDTAYHHSDRKSVV